MVVGRLIVLCALLKSKVGVKSSVIAEAREAVFLDVFVLPCWPSDHVWEDLEAGALDVLGDLGPEPGIVAVEVDEFSAEETQFSQNEAKPRWGGTEFARLKTRGL